MGTQDSTTTGALVKMCQVMLVAPIAVVVTLWWAQRKPSQFASPNQPQSIITDDTESLLQDENRKSAGKHGCVKVLRIFWSRLVHILFHGSFPHRTRVCVCVCVSQVS